MDHNGFRRQESPRRCRVQEVLLSEGKPGAAADFGQIPLLHGAGVERIEVVEANDFVALGQQRLDQMRTNEAGGAGHQHPRHLLARPIP